jgi:hypothetical protein
VRKNSATDGTQIKHRCRKGTYYQETMKAGKEKGEEKCLTTDKH